jgi:ABC transport system ATP-binding/permease protein
VPLLTLDRVSLSFGHLPLFDDASLRIEAGERICLIGRNGTGKSSLLKVIAGDVPPDGGSIWRAPGLRVSRLDQDVPGAADRTVFDEVAAGLGSLGALVAQYHHAAVEVAEAGADSAASLERLGELQHELEERDGWRLEQRVETVVSRLSLPAERSLGELSGGWRRRTLLGKALVSQPDLLLLDEPTNHLDIDAIQWLEGYLREFAGALLFVTHDRAFLSALATRIVDLDRGMLTSWPGAYSSYLDKKAEAENADARALDRLDKKLEKEEAWLRQGVKARRTRNEGRVRALLALRAERAAQRATSGDVRLTVDATESSGRLVFDADHVSKSFGGVPVVRDYTQRILRGDRIGLIGPNGSGKTTLLKLLVGDLEPDAGTIARGARVRIAYFDQQRAELDPEQSVADSVNDGNDTVIVNGEPRHIIGYLADFLFPRERAVSPIKSLSGGERNRLMLARLFARPANVLVMDEPTNDLDIETLELLEELIADFPGTVLLVSHDRAFLDNIVTSTLAFEGNGRVIEYVGGWGDYLRQREQRARSTDSAQRLRPERGAKPPSESERGWAASAEATASSAEASRRRGPANAEKSGRDASRSTDAGPEKRKLSFKEQREFESLPARIEALEEEQRRLTEESVAPDFYKSGGDHISGVLARIERITAEHEAALARWLELEERAVPRR